MPRILEQGGATFADLMKFPAKVDLRIIVDALELDSLKKLREALTDLCGAQEFPVRGEPRVSSNGRYVSYTIRVQVKDAALLNELYRSLGRLGWVKHVL